jgi:hypothetical protein
LANRFQTGRFNYQVSENQLMERAAEAAGLELVEQWSTWDQDAFGDAAEYCLTVHRLVD